MKTVLIILGALATLLLVTFVYCAFIVGKWSDEE